VEWPVRRGCGSIVESTQECSVAVVHQLLSTVAREDSQDTVRRNSRVWCDIEGFSTDTQARRRLRSFLFIELKKRSTVAAPEK
jgi:hypothetical protein